MLGLELDWWGGGLLMVMVCWQVDVFLLLLAWKERSKVKFS